VATISRKSCSWRCCQAMDFRLVERRLTTGRSVLAVVVKEVSCHGIIAGIHGYARLS